MPLDVRANGSKDESWSEVDLPLLETAAQHKRSGLSQCSQTWLKRIILMQGLCILVLLGIIVKYAVNMRTLDWELALDDNLSRVYSPVEIPTTSKDVIFLSGLHPETTRYSGRPSAGSDAAWEELYNPFGRIRISGLEAKKMLNQTVAIGDGSGDYMIGISVIHQLHCLNMIRKRLWASAHDLAARHVSDIEHLGHCIEELRQGLMCAADISPIPFVLDGNGKAVVNVNSVVHRCRDFDAVREWARKRPVESRHI